MSEWSGLAVALVGAVAMVVAGLFAAQATRRAAAATAEATRAAAAATAEPAQRQADLAAFREIRDDLQREGDQLREETTRLRSIVLAFAEYVSSLTTVMRASGIQPPDPPPLIDEYNRNSPR